MKGLGTNERIPFFQNMHGNNAVEYHLDLHSINLNLTIPADVIAFKSHDKPVIFPQTFKTVGEDDCTCTAPLPRCCPASAGTTKHQT